MYPNSDSERTLQTRDLKICWSCTGGVPRGGKGNVRLFTLFSIGRQNGEKAHIMPIGAKSVKSRKDGHRVAETGRESGRNRTVQNGSAPFCTVLITT